MKKFLAFVILITFTAVFSGIYYKNFMEQKNIDTLNAQNILVNDANAQETPEERNAKQLAQLIKDAPSMSEEQKKELDELMQDRFIGKENAPITIYVFSSFTCGHCGEFHKREIPPLKADFIDKGLVKLVFADYPLGANAIAASMLSRCVPKESNFNFITMLFENQGSWMVKNSKDILSNYAMLSGLSKEQADACLNNKNLLIEIIKKKEADDKTYEIEGTPTLVIKSKGHNVIKLAGVKSYTLVAEVINNLLKQNKSKIRRIRCQRKKVRQDLKK